MNDLMQTVESKTPLLKRIFRKEPSSVGLSWTNGEESEIQFSRLRFECLCAECVDEWTRERRVQSDQIAPDIRPLAIDPVGRYAVQIRWSDGHSAGIYTYETLYRLSTSKNGEK
ncbi:MAG TPA: DUF971 domain-containing protein [Oligoflexia bacterium]|nr:DUF971 domain-containing protein [Oligoflexia bacterium]